jgi:HK97 family phage major capsid protein
MKTLKELRDDLSHQTRSAADITEKHEKAGTLPTKEEQSAVEAFLRAAAEIQEEIDRRIKIEDMNKRTREAVLALNAPAAAPVVQRENPGTNEPERRTLVEVPSHLSRYGKLKAFRGQNAELDAYKSGMILRAALNPHDYRALRWCEKNGIEVRAMSEGTNTAGGALVANEMSQAIIDLRETYGIFRQNCKVVPMASDTMDIPRRTGGLTAAFVGEATAPTASDKSFDQIKLVAKKLATLTYLSEELNDDAIINLADDLAQECAYAFALKEDQCGFTGTGTSTYGGINGLTNILTTASGLKGAVAAASGHDTFGEIDATDLANCIGTLPQYAAMDAGFFCSKTCFDVVFSRLAINAGGNTIQTIAGAVQRSYLGYPIYISQVLPTSTGTINGTAMLFFGSLRLAAKLGERRGIQVRRSDEIKFVEGQIAIKATERVDINVHDFGDTTTAGPIVGLMGTS